MPAYARTNGKICNPGSVRFPHMIGYVCCQVCERLRMPKPMGRCATQALPGFDRCVSTFILQCTGEQVCIFATMPAYQTSCHGKICNPGSARLRQMLVYVRFSVGEILFLSNLGYQTICRVCANMDRCLYACLFQNQCGDVQLRLCQAST